MARMRYVFRIKATGPWGEVDGFLRTNKDATITEEDAKKWAFKVCVEMADQLGGTPSSDVDVRLTERIEML